MRSKALRLLGAAGAASLVLAIGASGQAEARPSASTFTQHLECWFMSGAKATSDITFRMEPGPSFVWTRIVYRTSPGVRADRVTWSYGKMAKAAAGGSIASRRDVPANAVIKPKNVTSILPVHLTMQVTAGKDFCHATFL